MEKKCSYEGHDYFPQYGVGPHRHDLSHGTFLNSTIPLKRRDWPKNYFEDKEVPGCGTYYCPECMELAPVSETQNTPQ